MDAHPDTVLVGRYRLLAPLGAGGMGAVWRAADELLDREVAIKLFAPATGHASDAARRRTEMQLLARTAHPTIVALFDARLDEDPAFLVMELVEGEDLATRLARGPLPPAQVRGIGLAVAAAIDSLARRGAVHRDVKPSNILLPADPSVVPAKLADFGIARLAGDAGLTTAGTTIGTAAYLSPEQVAGRELGSTADVYALGLVLLECLTGERAFPGTPTETAAARLVREPAIPAGLDAGWRQLLTGMCRLDPAERLDVAEALGMLGRMPATGPVPTPTAAMAAAPVDPGPATTPTARLAPADARPRSRARIGGIIAAGAAVVAVIVTAVALALAAPTPSATDTHPAVRGSASSSPVPSTTVGGTTVRTGRTTGGAPPAGGGVAPVQPAPTTAPTAPTTPPPAGGDPTPAPSGSATAGAATG